MQAEEISPQCKKSIFLLVLTTRSCCRNWYKRAADCVSILRSLQRQHRCVGRLLSLLSVADESVTVIKVRAKINSWKCFTKSISCLIDWFCFIESLLPVYIHLPYDNGTLWNRNRRNSMKSKAPTFYCLRSFAYLSLAYVELYWIAIAKTWTRASHNATPPKTFVAFSPGDSSHARICYSRLAKHGFFSGQAISMLRPPPKHRNDTRLRACMYDISKSPIDMVTFIPCWFPASPTAGMQQVVFFNLNYLPPCKFLLGPHEPYNDVWISNR